MRRLIAALLVALVLLVAAPAAPAQAQDDELPPSQVPTQDIIPEPDSGVAPDEAGDRGGALQLLLLGLVVAALAGGGFHLYRQSRRRRVEA